MKDVIPRLLAGEEIGTLFVARKRLTRKKCWIAFAFRTRGRARHRRRVRRRRSWTGGRAFSLPAYVEVEGDFSRGECVEITDGENRLIARGIVNYSSSDISKIKGSKSVEIERKLGYKYTEEVIHRDNMVLL